MDTHTHPASPRAGRTLWRASTQPQWEMHPKWSTAMAGCLTSPVFPLPPEHKRC